MISILHFLNLLAMAYLGVVEPHDSKSSHRTELANEAGFQIVCYHIAISMVSPGLLFDYVHGWALIVLVSFLIFANLLYVTILTCPEIFRKLRIYLHKRNSRNNVNKINQGDKDIANSNVKVQMQLSLNKKK